MIVGVVVLLIITIAFLPRLQEPVESGVEQVGAKADELLSPDNKTPRVQVVEKEIYVQVPGALNLSESTQQYSDRKVFDLIKDRAPEDSANKYTKGTMRAATQAELEEFKAELAKSGALTAVGRITDASYLAFWGYPADENIRESRREIGVGRLIVKWQGGGDKCYALVLVNVLGQTEVAALDPFRPYDQKSNFVWSEANTPGKEAYIVEFTRY